MKLTVYRSASFSGATMGKLYIDGVFACHTLEDDIREVPGRLVSTWKQYGKTAIPAGNFRVVLEDSPKFGPDTMTILNVPGYSSIRMHAGNTQQDTDGCILLGMQATDSTLIGGTSRPAVDMVKAEIKQAIAKGDDVSIEIVNPVTSA